MQRYSYTSFVNTEFIGGKTKKEEGRTVMREPLSKELGIGEGKWKVKTRLFPQGGTLKIIVDRLDSPLFETSQTKRYMILTL